MFNMSKESLKAHREFLAERETMAAEDAKDPYFGAAYKREIARKATHLPGSYESRLPAVLKKSNNHKPHVCKLISGNWMCYIPALPMIYSIQRSPSQALRIVLSTQAIMAGAQK